jgi:hypothetical protein
VRVHLPRTQSAAGGSRGWFRDRASPRGAPAAPVRTRCAWPSASRASWDAPPTRSVLRHRVSPPAFWIWRLVRAWSKAPGDTGRACPLPSSRVCGVLRAALACRERGPWPAYGPRTSRRRRPWALDARARRGGEVCRGGSQPAGASSAVAAFAYSARRHRLGAAISSPARHPGSSYEVMNSIAALAP